MIREDTPIEEYQLWGKTIYVKREDLTTTFPGPNNSKIRGVLAYLQKLKERGVTKVGVLDTKVSRAGWIVSYIASKLGITVYDFYPRYKDDKGLRFTQRMVKAFGGILVEQEAGRQSIRYARAKKYMQEVGGVMLPDMLKLREATIENAKVVESIDIELLKGTIIVPTGSATILSGIIRGLITLGLTKTRVYGILAANVSAKSRVNNVMFLLGELMLYPQPKVKIINCGYEYLTPCNIATPFPSDIYYDKKAWLWLMKNHEKLKEPILFWNVGGEWDIDSPYGGIEKGFRGDGTVSLRDIKKFLLARGGDVNGET
jgi:1-aminocyclopropane-1-carboxylate deaminase/D-cysteine desulfhydrase-like pyridoxal-dependent ACC family enzyme